MAGTDWREKARLALLGPGEPALPRGERIQLFGIPFFPAPLEEIAGLLRSWLGTGRRGIAVFTPDAWAVSRTILSPGLTELYREADLVVCDGTGLALASRVLGLPLPRIPGADLAWELCSLAKEEGLSVYLLGGKPGVAERAARRLGSAFPGIEVVGVHHGYFSSPGPAAEIAEKRPDLLLVGMGFPRQERWILAHRHLGAGVMVGVGATLDFWAGRVPRAPRPLRRVGLEWLWRAAVQPRRVARLWCVPFLLYQTTIAKIRLWLS